MQLYDNQYFKSVNQRILGSSPRGGASKQKTSPKGGVFCFNAVLGEKFILSEAEGSSRGFFHIMVQHFPITDGF